MRNHVVRAGWEGECTTMGIIFVGTSCHKKLLSKKAVNVQIATASRLVLRANGKDVADEGRD